MDLLLHQTPFTLEVVTATTFVGDVTGNADTATTSSNLALTDESSDTTCNVLFATAPTGNLPPKTGTNLTFNSNTGDFSATSATFEHTFVGSAVTTSESGINVVGVVTATSFVGSGTGLTGVGNTENIRTNTNATFLQNVNVSGSTTTGSLLVGSGVTISSDGDVFTTGITTIGKRILGISTNNIIPFLYNNYSDLPSASTYHGAFVHVHVAGKAFYAHAGNWTQLVNVGSDLTVGLGTEKYNVGILTASAIKVGSGVTLSSDGDAFVTGISTATKFVGDLSDAVTSRWSVVNDSANHYQFTGPGGLSSSNDPTIYLARGQTYEFNVNASGHPFHIQTSSGAYNASNLYTTGVTNPGAAVGVIKFAVPFAAPNTLYYVCENHPAMNGTIIVYPSI